MHIGDDEVINNCFAQTGYERIHERLLGLGSPDLEQQIGIIRGSFWAKTANQRSEVSQVETGRDVSIDGLDSTADDLLNEARSIARLLQREAIEGADGSFTWLSIVSQPHSKNYRFGQLGPGLFDGVVGVALFLAALESVSGCAGFRQLAIGTFSPIRRALNSCEKLFTTKNKSALQNFGLGLKGLGSIVYAMTRVGQLLQEEAALDIARLAACLINADFFADDVGLDVLNGRAGAILGLLSLYQVHSDPHLLDGAIALGDRVLECHEAAGLRVTPGFVQGPAGVAHALLRLYRATNEPRFLETARELMPVYSREGLDSLDASFRAGAAGLGLTWLDNLAILNNAECRSAVDMAVERCLGASLCGPDQVYSGIAGRLDLLVEASQHPGYGSPLLMQARKQGGWCISRARRDSGFRLHPQLPAGVFLPVFYEGLAGIGYEFLRLAFPEKLPSILLWN
jgi:class II lanthipeptide synthase